MTKCVVFGWTPEPMLPQFRMNFLRPLMLVHFQPVHEVLSGLQGRNLLVQGKFQAHLRNDGDSTVQDIYVVKGSKQPLLGWPAIRQLIEQRHFC